MKGPEGAEMDNSGCYLQVIVNELLVWTDGLLPGFRPKNGGFITAKLIFESIPGGTKYTAVVLHNNEDDRKKHQDMGFEDGWGLMLKQLSAYIKEHNEYLTGI